MSKKRHILVDKELLVHGARSLFPTSDIEGDVIFPIGVSIQNWEISSHSDCRIGNEMQMDDLAAQLQSASISTNESLEKQKPKKLGPPEIVFVESYVSLKFRSVEVLRFDAASALLEWARAHQGIDNEKNASKASYKGVSVIQTKDAQLWKDKKTSTIDNISTVAVNMNTKPVGPKRNAKNPGVVENNFTSDMIGTSREFNFDWTYSTPYAGTIHESLPNPNLDTDFSTSSFPQWILLPESGIQSKIHLLTDTTQPILYYHEITFYEDDLHDNGIVSLSLKIRIMPTCFFILCRLYVRVDHVLVRCRDTRILHEFCKSNSTDNNKTKVKIFRDISWKEAKWNDLNQLGLPQDIRMWMDGNERLRGQTDLGTLPQNLSGQAHLRGKLIEQKQKQQGAYLHSLLNKLPVASLPNNLPCFSCMEI